MSNDQLQSLLDAICKLENMVPYFSAEKYTDAEWSAITDLVIHLATNR